MVGHVDKRVLMTWNHVGRSVTTFIVEFKLESYTQVIILSSKVKTWRIFEILCKLNLSKLNKRSKALFKVPEKHHCSKSSPKI